MEQSRRGWIGSIAGFFAAKGVVGKGEVKKKWTKDDVKELKAAIEERKHLTPRMYTTIYGSSED